MEREIPTAVTISHVGRRWRCIALRTPELWRFIRIESNSNLEKLHAYLERSQPVSIDVVILREFFIDIPDGRQSLLEQRQFFIEQADRDRDLHECLRKTIDHSDPTLPLPLLFKRPTNFPSSIISSGPSIIPADRSLTGFLNILDLLIPNIPRMRVLVARFSDYRWAYLFLARLHQSEPADVLEMFDLYHHSFYFKSSGGFPPPALSAKFIPFRGQAPRLKTISLHSVHLNWDKGLGFLKDLKILSWAFHNPFFRPSFQTFATILQSSPKLDSLRLVESGPSGNEDEWKAAGYSVIRLPTLQELTLAHEEPSYSRALLQFLDMPNLKKLSLRLDRGHFVADLCKPAHGRSHSLLFGVEHLHLTVSSCTAALADQIIKESTNLVSLSLLASGGHGALFLDALLKTFSPDSLPCPKLEVLKTQGVPGDIVRKYAQLRRNAGYPLSARCHR